MQTIASTAPGAPITPLNRSWIDGPRRRVDVESHILLGRAAEAGEVAGVFAFLASNEAATAVDPNSNGAGPFQCLIHLNPVGREQARDVVALPATNDILRRFNRDTQWLATGILGALVSAALVLAVLIKEGQPKAVDQAKEEGQTGGNAFVNANPGPLSKAVGLNAESSTGEVPSRQATSVDHWFTSPHETPSLSKCAKLSDEELAELAHLLANPVLPKASRHWSGPDVVIASVPQSGDLLRSFYPSDREVLTEHALEVSYFFEVLRDPFHEEALIDHCCKIEFFGRLAAAAEACLLEQPDATAHLVCAAVLREANAIAKQIDEGEFDFFMAAQGNQTADDPTVSGQRIGYSSIKETIEFFHGRGIQIHGTA